MLPMYSDSPMPVTGSKVPLARKTPLAEKGMGNEKGRSVFDGESKNR